MPILTDNKCNGGKLLSNNLPFWWNPEKLVRFGTSVAYYVRSDCLARIIKATVLRVIPTNGSNGHRWISEDKDITDDDIVMYTNVIIKVLENRLKLVPMPDIQIILDPVEDLTVLQARKAQCFTKDIIFGNTVRSMVNLNEMSLRMLLNTSKGCAPESDVMRSINIGNQRYEPFTRFVSCTCLLLQLVPPGSIPTREESPTNFLHSIYGETITMTLFQSVKRDYFRLIMISKCNRE
ncbi:hypothetical protein KIN20_020722 [Parelaphostrongylus tenuis]|uniref:Uncharacterized protein n=1 Tax=Parelaphostrongylus tenuis TaxID=148309 RepID=A0AAD5N4F2_PARTN|nr:hypothetical protein KIN20_020722 [Parelaphostrongylus tenuis]